MTWLYMGQTSASDANSGTNFAAPKATYGSINTAAAGGGASLFSGDIIFIRAGTYNQRLFPNKQGLSVRPYNPTFRQLAVTGYAQDTVFVTNASGLAIGQHFEGAGIDLDSKIKAINGLNITLDKLVRSNPAGTPCFAYDRAQNDAVIIDGDGASYLPNTDYGQLVLMAAQYVWVSGLEIRNANVRGNKGIPWTNNPADDVFAGYGVQMAQHRCKLFDCYVHDIWAGAINCGGDYCEIAYCETFRDNLANAQCPESPNYVFGFSAAQGRVTSGTHGAIGRTLANDGGWNNAIQISDGGSIAGAVNPGYNTGSVVHHCFAHDGFGECISLFHCVGCESHDNIMLDAHTVLSYLHDSTDCKVYRNLMIRSASPLYSTTTAPEGAMLTDERSDKVGFFRNLFFDNDLFNTTLSVFGWTLVPNTGPIDSIIANNTVIGGRVNICAGANVITSGTQIRNNIFDTTNVQAGSPGVLAGTVFSNNSWRTGRPSQVSSPTDLSMTADVMLNKTGPVTSREYFKKNAGSPAINTGVVIAGVTDVPDYWGTVRVGPDMGSHEFNINPVAANDSSLGNTIGQPVTVNVLSNDTDAGLLVGSTLQLVGTPSAGASLVVPGEGTWAVNATTFAITFTPLVGYTGNPAQIFYIVLDNQDAPSNVGAVTVTYASGNAAPVAVPNISTGNALGQPVTVNVLANDSDADGTLNPATVRIAGTGSDGAPSIVPNQGAWTVNTSTGAITFTPEPTFYGNPTPISYTVKDNLGSISSGVLVTVEYAANVAPVAATNTSPNNTPGTAVTVDVLANDSDPGGSLNPATVRITGTASDGAPLPVPGQGVWTVNTSTGALTFTPNAGFTGNPSRISYSVADNLGLRSNLAPVTVTYTQTVSLETGFTGLVRVTKNYSAAAPNPILPGAYSIDSYFDLIGKPALKSWRADYTNNFLATLDRANQIDFIKGLILIRAVGGVKRESVYNWEYPNMGYSAEQATYNDLFEKERLLLGKTVTNMAASGTPGLVNVTLSDGSTILF